MNTSSRRLSETLRKIERERPDRSPLDELADAIAERELEALRAYGPDAMTHSMYARLRF